MTRRFGPLSALLFVAPLVVGAPPAAAQSPAAPPVVWNSEIPKRDAAWYATPEARVIADNVLKYQSAEGAWPKNVSLAEPPAGPIDAGSTNTIDNQATTLPMAYLARVITAGNGDVAAYQAAFQRGLDYLLTAQYPNGGWPQFYPLRGGYYDHVTFNDDAMIRVMTLLRDVAGGRPPYAFVDAERRARAAEAVARGTEVILKTQLKQDGRLAVWCAQYDERTLEPAWARRFEPPSYSGGESVAIVRFLMGVSDPSPEVIAAIEGAAAWYRTSVIEGVRVETFTDAEGRRDRRVVADPAAGPLWARFYALDTGRPVFMGRESIARSTFAEIERERRAGYSYYVDTPQKLLTVDYPAWRRRVGSPS